MQQSEALSLHLHPTGDLPVSLDNRSTQSATHSVRLAPPQPSPLKCAILNFPKHTLRMKTSQIAAKKETALPPECGGGPHSSTMPWPWRTDTVLLVLVLKFSRSAKKERTQLKGVS